MVEPERFSLSEYFNQRWERIGRRSALQADSMSEYLTWRDTTRTTLRQLIGYDTFQSAPLLPRITEEVTFPEYIRQRVELQTEPGVVMPLYVLIPRQGKATYPAVIAPHGHGSGGKYSVAGCREIPEISGAIDLYNYDYGVQFARAGLIAFCPDARGFGERQERWSRASILNSSCREINAMGYPLGQTITGMWAWDLHRLVDYVTTRADCAPGKIACAGLSGGGLQTLWATALDERIRCAVISGYMYGYRESLLEMCENCWCNYVPHLYEYVDMGDIAALIAPRPLFIETGNRDPLNGASGLANVTSQLDIIERAYKVWDAGQNLVHDVCDGEHRWYGMNSVPWLVRMLAAI
ncbi:MAG: dienelactone hydrolase family protein [Anaerolineae bacterium]